MARASGASDYRSGELSHQDERGGSAHGRYHREGNHEANSRCRGHLTYLGAGGGADLDWRAAQRGCAGHRAGGGHYGGQAHQRLIPLCHQLALTGVDVDFTVGQLDIEITATVRSTDRTGVEMEALTAVSVAALTLYDMIKAVDPGALIDDIRVLHKEGGRRGTWTRR